MGVNIRVLTKPEAIRIEDLGSKIIVIDAYNQLFQYLSTIRSADGTPLKDSRGNVTSHLAGLFFRTAALMSVGVRLAFVFDGEPPDLKLVELNTRAERKAEALAKYKRAQAEEDIKEMKKQAARTSKLTDGMVGEAKALVEALGLSAVQAPSEADAQIAYFVKKGEAWAGGSQDYDLLLHGAPRLIRNLSVSRRKKLPSKVAYAVVEPELIRLGEMLSEMGISQEMLIALGIIVGTDYNPGGAKGIGPKKALRIVKEADSPEKAFKQAELENGMEIFSTIKNMKVSEKERLKWKPVNKERVIELLCEEHEFASERINKALDNIPSERSSQKGLGEFI